MFGSDSVFMNGSYLQDTLSTPDLGGVFSGFPAHYTIESGQITILPGNPASMFIENVDTDGMGSTIFGLDVNIDASGSMHDSIQQLIALAHALVQKIANSPYADATIVRFNLFNGTGIHSSEYVLASEMNLIVDILDKLVTDGGEYIGSYDEVTQIEEIIRSGRIPVVGCTPTSFMLMKTRGDVRDMAACARQILGRHFVNISATLTDGGEMGSPQFTAEDVQTDFAEEIRLGGDLPFKLIERSHGLLVYVGRSDVRVCRQYAKAAGFEFASSLEIDPEGIADLIANFALTKSAYAAANPPVAD